MHRLPEQLAGRSFDLVVVGGGITGCCIARDAARRGLSVALVERDDFSGATSAATSRLIHGGLRYLRQGQVGVVRESLRERRIWSHVAPGAVRPAAFLLPTFGVANHVAMRAALALYDALAWDRDRALPAAERLPRTEALSRDALVARAPVLTGTGATGGIAYADVISEAPERLALAVLADAIAHGAVCVNHMEAVARQDAAGSGIVARDRRTDIDYIVNASVVVNATGPWADVVAARLGAERPPRLLRSKGIHLLVPALPARDALLVPVDGRHFFVIPWHGFSLIGTTDTVHRDGPETPGVSREEIATFMAVVARGLPGVTITPDDVRYAYAGLRPLVASDGDSYRASRRAEVLVDPTGLVTVIGGKWTTSRAVAAACVDRLVRDHRLAAAPCDTQHAPLPWARAALPSDDAADTKAIRRALRDEMAVTLEDVLFRRTHFGIMAALHERGDARLRRLERWATAAGAVAGWDATERSRQLDAVLAHYQRVSA